MSKVRIEHDRSLVGKIEDVARLLPSIDNVEVVDGMSVLVFTSKRFNVRQVKARKKKVKSPEAAVIVVVCSVEEANEDTRVEDCLTVEVS